jgi:hypothetical protein
MRKAERSIGASNAMLTAAFQQLKAQKSRTVAFYVMSTKQSSKCETRKLFCVFRESLSLIPSSNSQLNFKLSNKF